MDIVTENAFVFVKREKVSIWVLKCQHVNIENTSSSSLLLSDVVFSEKPWRYLAKSDLKAAKIKFITVEKTPNTFPFRFLCSRRSFPSAITSNFSPFLRDKLQKRGNCSFCSWDGLKTAFLRKTEDKERESRAEISKSLLRARIR